VRGRWSVAGCQPPPGHTSSSAASAKAAFSFPAGVSRVPRCLESVAAPTDAAPVADRDAWVMSVPKKGNAPRPEGEAPLPSQSTAPVFQLSGACRGFASRSGGGQANSLPPLVAARAMCPRSKRAARGCGETADERIRGFQRLFSTGTWCVSAPSGRAIVRCGGERRRKQSPRPRSGVPRRNAVYDRALSGAVSSPALALRISATVSGMP
jgi:hypothetical protein